MFHLSGFAYPEGIMPLHLVNDLSIPEETQRVAQAAFPKGNTYMRMRDELGPIYTDEQLAELFPTLCPRGHPSRKWSVVKQNKTLVYSFRFHRAACDHCPVRAQCTRSATSLRSLTIQPQAAYEALRAARQRQREKSFRQQYASRAGLEGTMAQGNAMADLRRARYIGLAKTHFQHLLTALGLNILRLGVWWAERPHARTQISPFARLAPAPAAPA